MQSSIAHWHSLEQVQLVRYQVSLDSQCRLLKEHIALDTKDRVEMRGGCCWPFCYRLMLKRSPRVRPCWGRDLVFPAYVPGYLQEIPASYIAITAVMWCLESHAPELLQGL